MKLKIAEGHRHVHPGGGLDLVDLALPLDRDRGADVDQPARARERLPDDSLSVVWGTPNSPITESPANW